MDKALIEIILIVIAAWVLFFFGILHTSRAATIRREKRAGKTWLPGKYGSPTSNSRRAYELHVQQFEKKGTRIRVTGTLQGCMPHRNETAYLEAEGERVIVLILSLREESMPDEEKGVRVSMKLMGVPRALRARLTSAAQPPYNVTNLRLKKETPEEKAPESESESSNKESATQTVQEPQPVELHYPIVVKSPLREIFQALLPTVIGFCLMDFGVIGFLVDDGSASIAICLSIGCLMLGFGIFMLISALGFQLTVKDRQVSVRRYFRTTVYHIDNLHTHTHLATDSSEKWIMDISNTAGGQVATINSTYPHYAEVFEAFRQAVNRQNEERRQAALRRYLTENEFYVLGLTIQTQNQKIVMPNVLTRKDNGKLTLFLFDSEEEAHRNYPDASLIPAKLAAALSMRNELKADVLAIWAPANGMKPLEVTEELLQSLQINTDGTDSAEETAKNKD